MIFTTEDKNLVYEILSRLCDLFLKSMESMRKAGQIFSLKIKYPFSQAGAVILETIIGPRSGSGMPKVIFSPIETAQLGSDSEILDKMKAMASAMVENGALKINITVQSGKQQLTLAAAEETFLKRVEKFDAGVLIASMGKSGLLAPPTGRKVGFSMQETTYIGADTALTVKVHI